MPPADAQSTRAGLTRRVFSLLGPVVLLAGLAACSDNAPDPSTLPDGATLLSESATAMSDLQSVHLLVDVDPPLGSTPAIARADLDLTAEGASAGEVEAVLGALISLKLVTLADGTSYLDLPGQGWTESGLLSEQYDTTAILDPARGLPKLLSSGTDAVTKGSEQVNGTDAWKVSLTFSTTVVEALVPAELPEGGLTGDVWLAKDSKMLLKSVMNAPATDVSPPAIITLTLSNFNVPVDIRAPIS